MDRTKFIGASEIAAVMGLSPWQTPLQVWMIKTGKVEPDDLSEVEAVEWGTRLERVVSDKFAEKNGVKLIAYKKRFVHEKYPFLSCELDNIISGTDEIVEIKTANFFAHRDWKDEDDIPIHYVLQVMMQLGLSKRKVGHIAVLIGGQKYLEKRIEFDQALYDTMVESAVKFWDMVQNETPPATMGADNETMVDLYPAEHNDLIEENEDMNDAIALIQESKMHIKELKAQQDEAEAKLKSVIGDNLGILTSKYKTTWKEQVSKRINTQAVKDDGLYDKYARESKSRVLRVKLLNK